MTLWSTWNHYKWNCKCNPWHKSTTSSSLNGAVAVEQSTISTLVTPRDLSIKKLRLPNLYLGYWLQIYKTDSRLGRMSKQISHCVRKLWGIHICAQKITATLYWKSLSSQVIIAVYSRQKFSLSWKLFNTLEEISLKSYWAIRGRVNRIDYTPLRSLVPGT